MSENSTCGIANETAMSAAAVAEDGSTKSYLELPPLVEDNEGIGTVMEIGKCSPFCLDQANHKTLQAELKRAREQDDFIDKKKVPLQLFFPPYFRDMYDMVPTVNSEARRRTIDGVYDSLIREEKKWTQTELKKLRVAVLKSVLEKRLEPFVERRQCIIEKIRQSGRETTEEDKEEWRQKAEGLNRAIQYQLSLPEEEILSADKTDYSEVDWLKISNIDFLGIRTPKQVRLKWMYEQSPQWSKAEWSWEELRKLYSLRKESCIDWSIVADDMGAQRTPYQCLEKYKTAIGPLLYSKPWTKQEDSRLSILVKALQNNADVPWSVVSVFMDGRSQYESRNRYEQFSLSGRNYGKWNVAEDVRFIEQALLCAVARYGTRDWTRVANMLVSRSRTQCRERWVNMFSKRVVDTPWTLAEDEKLLYGIKVFGKGKWTQISALLPGRSANDCKMRFRSLVNTKLKIYTNNWNYSLVRGDTTASRRRRRQKVGEHFAELVRVDEEDVKADRIVGEFDEALLCAVARYGTRDWTRVANMLVSRSRTQCRERWVNMFSKRVVDTPWTLAEDEKLLYGIKVFGKGKWTQISALLPGRSANDCKMRFRSLVNTKLKIYTNNWNYSLVRGDTTASRRRRRQKVGEHFAELVRVDEEDVKADRIVGEFDEAMGEDNELRMRLKPERRNAITRAVEEINKRASNGGSLETWFALLDDLRITSDMLDDTTLSIVKRYCDEESISSLRDRRTILSAEEQTRFNSSLKELPDDQAKIQFITDSLFELVLRADEKRQCDDDPFRRPNVNEEVYRYFDHNLIDALLSHLENGTKPSPILPCVATLEILDQIKNLIDALLSHLENGTKPSPILPCVATLEILDQIKMKLRSMLYLPMLMDRAIEPESSWRIRSVHHEIAKKQRREAAAYRRASSTQAFESSNLLGSPAKRELTVRDVVMRNLPLDKLMSAVHGNEERVQTLATYLASEKKEISTADEQRLAKLDESIESVRAKVKVR
ncbi:snRNA-activating protein complex subunit 4 [Toxocara canis]|uniref:snRNA-activating protein complex subunit 4 n=1 Tax=Toxocara canis TaxID=6265 RepID=A0A0B2W546_TOXCA|nr:snRNA-activating protein complex subunit 4 [Toxocara canis]